MLLNSKCPQISEVRLRNSATYVDLKVGDVSVRTLVDSGAESSLISKKLAEKLRLKVVPDDSNTIYIAANGQPLNTVGCTLLRFKMGQFEMTQWCTIISGLSTDLLLGTDALVHYGMVINFEKHYLSVGKVTAKIYTNMKQKTATINATSRIVLKPQGTHIEYMSVPAHFKSSLFVESVALKEVYIKNGLFDANEGRIPIIITNKRNYPVEIPKGKYLARVEEVLVVVEKSIDAVVRELVAKGVDNKKISEIVKMDSKLTAKQKEKMDSLVNEYDDIFSKDKNDLGFWDKTEFKIDTGTERPIKQRAYRVPYAQQENVDKLIEEMFQNKIISKSNSPWASPIVIVKKSDGSDRFCVDYRKLNGITVKDSYPLPLIQEILDGLMGDSWFTTLDLASGYWQHGLDEES